MSLIVMGQFEYSLGKITISCTVQHTLWVFWFGAFLLWFQCSRSAFEPWKHYVIWLEVRLVNVKLPVNENCNPWNSDCAFCCRCDSNNLPWLASVARDISPPSADVANLAQKLVVTVWFGRSFGENLAAIDILFLWPSKEGVEAMEAFVDSDLLPSNLTENKQVYCSLEFNDTGY